MSGDDTASLAAGGLMLVLVVANLASRRLPMLATLRLALTWAMIFAIIFVLFLFRDEGRAVFERARTELTGGGSQMVGSELRIPISSDGHFHVDAFVNDVPVRFLIDTGATTTAMSTSAAERAGIVADSSIAIQIVTANGTISASTARAATLRVGSIVQSDARLVFAPAFGETNVLGMSFLNDLAQWRVERGVMILTPQTPTPTGI